MIKRIPPSERTSERLRRLASGGTATGDGRSLKSAFVHRAVRRVIEETDVRGGHPRVVALARDQDDRLRPGADGGDSQGTRRGVRGPSSIDQQVTPFPSFQQNRDLTTKHHASFADMLATLKG